MAWECFMVEAVRPFVEFFTICADGHRIVHEVHDDAEFEAVVTPTVGYPRVCPECLAEIETASRMGGHVYRRPETGEEHRHQHEFGPGAMFDATEWGTHMGPDGRAYGVILPPGGVGDLWLIDGPATGGGGWTRTGVPPKLTVTPSILTPRYHSFLTDGVLADSLGDRPL